MTLLPVAERELRLATRRPAIRWTRLGAALLAGSVVGLALLFAAGTGTGGAGLFRFLISLLFLYSSLAGVFLTADCLSLERREGTLGLLFLTDLRGYDVVLGKLVARALTAFYGWLATLPIVAITLLFGGVTGGEFARLSLALLAVLCLSLTLGLAVSAVVERDQPAMSLTFLLLVGLNVIPVWMSAAGWGRSSGLPPLGPVQLCHAGFDLTYRVDPAGFWLGWLWIQGLAGLCLLGACWLLPHTWRRTTPYGPGRPQPRRARWPWSLRGNTDAGRQAQGPGPGNPVAWLVARTALMSRRWIWVAAAGGGALWLAVGFSAARGLGPEALMWFGHSVGLVLRVLMAFQASRFLIQARRSGELELLMSTPLSALQMVDGQIEALQRLFLGPALLGVLLHLLPAGLSWLATAQTAPSLLSGDWLLSTGMGTYYAVQLIADLYATAWLAMWLALTRRRPGWAPLLTLLYLMVLPTFAFCVPRILIDVPVIFVARDRLRREFIPLARRWQEGPLPRVRRRVGVPPPLPAG